MLRPYITERVDAYPLAKDEGFTDQLERQTIARQYRMSGIKSHRCTTVFKYELTCVASKATAKEEGSMQKADLLSRIDESSSKAVPRK